MKKKIGIVLIILIVLLGIIGIFLFQNDAIRFKFSYESINYAEYENGKKIKVSIPWDNRIKYLSSKEILPFLEEKTGIFYLGYNTCPWCRNIVSTLIQVSKDYDIETIYYVDIHKEDISQIKSELITKLNDFLEENEEGKKVIAVPDVYFVKNGEIIGHHIGTVDSYHNPYSGMNEKQKKELYSIYEEYIKELKK